MRVSDGLGAIFGRLRATGRPPTIRRCGRLLLVLLYLAGTELLLHHLQILSSPALLRRRWPGVGSLVQTRLNAGKRLIR